MNGDTKTDIESARVVHSGTGDIVIGGSFVPQPTTPANGSNLPHGHPSFVGRVSELMQIKEALDSRAWIITIDGLGGIGKTTLALEAAHYSRSSKDGFQEFDGYVWVSARGKMAFGLLDVCREIVSVLAATPPVFDSDAAVISSARKYLSEGRRLIIIDNFETVADEHLFAFLRDLPKPSKAIITSRHHLHTGERVVPLGGLDEATAVQFLESEAYRLHIAISPTDRNQLKILADKAHGIPLVLRWAMERIRDGRTLETVIRSLDEATANDIYDFIYEFSLSELDDSTKTVFLSFALFGDYVDTPTIVNTNISISAVAERVAQLVARTLVEDNQRLSVFERKYRLHPFTRNLARRRLAELQPLGQESIRNAMGHFAEKLQLAFEGSVNLLDADVVNIGTILVESAATEDMNLCRKAITLIEALARLRLGNRPQFLRHLASPLFKIAQADRNVYADLMKTIQNPYSWGYAPHGEYFFGRESELRCIDDTIGSGGGRMISLVGPRRIGKTTLLLRAAEMLATKDCQCVFVDCSIVRSRKDFFAVVLNRVERIMGSNDAIRVSPEDVELGDAHRFMRYMLNLEERLSPRRIVLILDEFEFLHSQDDFDDALSSLRALLNQRVLDILTAGFNHFGVSDARRFTSPLFNVAQVMQIGGLSNHEARSFILIPADNVITYEENAISMLIKETGGVPWILLSACRDIYDICTEAKCHVVTVEIARRCLEGLFSNRGVGRSVFDSLLHMPGINQSLLADIGRTVSHNGGIVTIAEMEDSVRFCTGEDHKREVRHLLGMLTGAGLLKPIDGATYEALVPMAWEIFAGSNRHSDPKGS